MSAINRAALAENLWPGIHAHWGSSYPDYPEQHLDTFDTEQSNKAYEEYVMEYNFGLNSIKDAGQSVNFDEAGNAWKGRVEMVAVGLGFILTREAIDDDQYFDLVPKYTRALKRSMLISKQVRAAAFIDGVFTTSMTGDGKPVCAPDHPLKNGGVWSNTLAGNADLNETSMEAAAIQIGDWTDERGLQVMLGCKHLVVPNGMQFTAERITTSQLRPGTGDNDPNAMRQMGTMPGGYRVNNFLADKRSWYIKTNLTPGDGMIYWNRIPLDIEQGEGTDQQVFKVIAYERYAFSCGDPRGFFGVPGQP